MKSGTEISEHTSTREAFVTVLKGRGLFTLEDEKIELSPSVFIPMEPNAKHAIRADEDLIFILGLVG